MYIQEEFLKRHGYDEPILNYFSDSDLLLKYEGDKIVHTLMKVEFKLPPKETGHFVFQYYKPVHNSYRRSPILTSTANKYFDKEGKDILIEWDQYYNYLSTLFGGWVDTIPVLCPKTVKKIVWEMFVYCFDGWFVEQRNQNLLNLLYKSLRNNSEDILEYLRDEYKIIHTVFMNDFSKFITANYCYPLGIFAQHAIDNRNLK